ncbi:MAG: FumA C-terminus/TtdB family hydratase beta subunit [Candidatus Melainabacteria bacterium]
MSENISADEQTKLTEFKNDPVKLTGREIRLRAPISEEQIRSLKVGDVVLIDGMLYTGRDAIHKHLTSNDSPVDLKGQIIYHCGPVVTKDAEGNWQIKAAGPTTSSREEPYQADIIKKFGLRAVMGKGGMGAKTLAGLKESGAVYLNAIGGAAQYYSACIKGVRGVDLLEFGIPEAMWHLEVEGFAAIVTMDANGNSLHADVDKSSLDKLSELKEPVFV